jgi:spore coat protein U-like protein
MHIDCRRGFPYMRALVCIGLENPGDVGWDPRTLSGPGGRRLDYNIYSDPTYRQIWGSAHSPGAEQVGVTMQLSVYGTGSADVFYYAKLRAAQNNARAGDYSRQFSDRDVAVRLIAYFGGGQYVCTADMPVISRFSFTVRARTVPDCAIQATNLDFGTADGSLANAPRTGTSTITATCTQGSNYSIALDRGRGAGATVAERRLTRAAGIDTLLYRLYSTPVRNRLWGDGSFGTDTVSGSGNGVQDEIVHTVYGELEAQEPGRSGTYTDIITATITY